MKRLVCLAILTGFAMPCAATGPKVDGTAKPDGPCIDARQFVFVPQKLVIETTPPPPLLDDRVMKAVVAPLPAVAVWALNQTYPEILPPRPRTTIIIRGVCPAGDNRRGVLPLIPGMPIP